MIFPVQEDDTNIFSIRRQDQSADNSQVKFHKISTEYKNRVYFSWFFQHYSIKQTFSRFDGRIKVLSSQEFISWIFLIDHNMGFIFHDVSELNHQKIILSTWRQDESTDKPWILIEKSGLVFMTFPALYDYTTIFSISQQDKSAAITKFKF